MSDQVALTGERLADENRLYAADLARHRIAYVFAAERAGGRRVLDLGCGTGYGSAELSESAGAVVGFDRVRPGDRALRSGASFVRGDLNGLPLAENSFDLVVSFQVIEHLLDPTAYLEAIARVLRPDGLAIVTTPNLAQSDKENPFHVHEYEAEELRQCLAHHFQEVEMHGVGAVGPAWDFHEARLARIRNITRLDPLKLRRILPESLVEWLFARLSLVVRRLVRRDTDGPEVGIEHFPVGEADDRCLDLMALCRRPRDQGR